MKETTHKQNEHKLPQKEVNKPVMEEQHIAMPQPDVAVTAQARRDPRAITPQNILTLQRTVGNRAVQRLIQQKLSVNAPDDAYEQEANRVAHQVMTMTDPQSVVARPTTVQLQDATEDKLQGKREIQRASSGGDLEASDNLSAQLGANMGAGSPLPAETREFMESRFGVDFSGVRIHADHEAMQMSQAVQAQAFTYGNDIYFNAGKYNPDSSDGKQLLAHELTHAIQQQAVGPQPRRKKLEVSNPGDSVELEADRAANAVSWGQTVSVPPASGAVSIARKKEAPTPFAGSAGTADVRAGQAGAEAGGVAPISVSTDYALQQADRKEKQMDAFRQADIRFVYDNQEHYAYKKLIELRQEYVNDVSRITLAQGAFNDFVVPGTLANKSTAQFERLQFELGYFDDVYPTQDLSKKELDTLAKKLDEDTVKKLNLDIRSKEDTTRGLRKEILGTSHKIQAAMQKRAGILAVEAKDKAEQDKAAINEKIKAVKDGADTIGQVISVVSFAGFGGPAAIKAIGAGGSEAIQTGLELGGTGTGLVGTAAEFIMTKMYEEDIQKARQEIEKAKAAEEHAKKLDAELSLTGSMLTVEGQLQQLSGAMGQLALALEAREDYFAKLGAETDKATGQKPGGKMSQYLAYVSQANETKSHIETAKDSASSGLGEMKTQINEMLKHRTYAYVADSGGVFDPNARKVDAEGPDLELLKAARDGLAGFLKSADKQLEVIDRVTASLPSPE